MADQRRWQGRPKWRRFVVDRQHEIARLRRNVHALGEFTEPHRHGVGIKIADATSAGAYEFAQVANQAASSVDDGWIGCSTHRRLCHSLPGRSERNVTESGTTEGSRNPSGKLPPDPHSGTALCASGIPTGADEAKTRCPT